MKTNNKFIIGIFTLSTLFLMSSCMGFFSNLFKKQHVENTANQKQEDTFCVISFEGDEKPAVGMFNERLISYSNKAAYPWNCSVVVSCKSVNPAGLPTDEEAEILNAFEDSLNAKIVADTSNPNALFFGRINWNSTRELIWKVKNPEPVADYLQSVISDKNSVRQIDFKIEKDPKWELTEFFSNGISKTRQ